MGTKLTKLYQDKGFEICVIILSVACEPQQGSSWIHKTPMSIIPTECHKIETGADKRKVNAASGLFVCYCDPDKHCKL